MNPILVIPARLASMRLPRKPLAEIAGEPMILHVWRRAVAAAAGPVVVASCDPEILAVVAAAGGQAVATRPDHPSGSDRVQEAVMLVDPDRRHDVVVNLQGDLPLIDPAAIRAALLPLADAAVEIATLAAPIQDAEELAAASVVKVAAGFAPGAAVARALYFSRVPIPSGAGAHYHHIGLYAFRRAALDRFVALPRGVLEARESLEQLRALEAGMRIDVALVDTVPLGVDTPADLTRIRALIAAATPP